MSITEIIAIIALVGYAIYKQTRVHEVTGQNRFKLATIYAVVGVCIGVTMPHSVGTVILLGTSLLASLLVGYIRGRGTRIWAEADGRILARGTATTITLFLVLIGFKFLLGTVAYLTHTPFEGGIGEVLVMVGLMLGVQAELVWRRAQQVRASAERTGQIPVLV
jgi:hypothetical protein